MFRIKFSYQSIDELRPGLCNTIRLGDKWYDRLKQGYEVLIETKDGNTRKAKVVSVELKAYMDLSWFEIAGNVATLWDQEPLRTQMERAYHSKFDAFTSIITVVGLYIT